MTELLAALAQEGGRILVELGRPEDGRSALGTGMRISEELGVRWPLAGYQVFLAFERFVCGEWDDAIAELEASIELTEETGYIYSRVYAHGMLSLISLHRNDLDAPSRPLPLPPVTWPARAPATE